MNYHYFLYLFEHLSIYNLPKNYPKLLQEMMNYDIIKNTYEKGNGVILISAHVGNWEVGIALLAMMGYEITVVAETQLHPIISEQVKELKKRLGIKVVSIENMRCIMNDIRQGHIIGLVVDGDVFSGGKVVEFLNNSTIFPLGPEKLCKRFNCPIIFGYTRRLNNGKLSILFDNEIIYPTIDSDISQIIAYKISDYIFTNLDQWQIYRKLW
jgi:Kdo2-lipid IVA lauroyltransferase/acyltransferase